MRINALTARRLADQRHEEQIQQALNKTITKPVQWVLCWGKIDYKTGIWEWKNERGFESRTAARARKNSLLRYPVADQNACYIVRRYPRENKNNPKAVESIHETT